jgi:D-alanine-D-alanine ligase
MPLTKIETPKVKTVAVLYGGWSKEQDVSRASGKACAQALRNKGYEVREIEVEADLKKLLNDLSDLPDVVFNALHGTGGEDGCIQGVLDMLGVPYTHSGRLASALAMDKQRAKLTVEKAGVQVAEGLVLSAEDIRAGNIPLDPPYVIKPNHEGSSVGVFIIREGDNRLNTVLKNWHFGEAVVERYIPGRELTVSVAGSNNNDISALTVTEITSSSGFYDYDAKYKEGGSIHVVPAQVPADVFDTAMDWAVKSHKALGCQGVTRTDFRYDNSQSGTSGLYYLETNTQPGMTSTSLVPEQAGYAGFSFDDLVQWMVETAACRS